MPRNLHRLGRRSRIAPSAGKNEQSARGAPLGGHGGRGPLDQYPRHLGRIPELALEAPSAAGAIEGNGVISAGGKGARDRKASTSVPDAGRSFGTERRR